MLDPYFDSGAMMTSYTTAIERDGGAVGVTGIDVALDALDKQAKAVEVLDSGYAFVAAPTGTLRRVPGEEGLDGQEDREGDRRARRRHERPRGLVRPRIPSTAVTS